MATKFHLAAANQKRRNPIETSWSVPLGYQSLTSSVLLSIDSLSAVFII